MAKQAKYEGLLDSLPDQILCHILSFLPTRDAVRTSILSRRWRYLFTSSISKLDFHDIKDGLPDPRDVSKQRIKSFKKFVERVFFSPKHQRLEYFRVDDLWVADEDLLSVYNWLCAALWRGVREIDVFLFYADLEQFPNLLFTCSSLVTLKLQFRGSGAEMEVPTNVCSPNLRTLHLKDMEFVDGCSFPRLISGCPVLEDLGLFGCFVDGVNELYIHSLLLKRLVLNYETFTDVQYRYDDLNYAIVIDAPSLVYLKYIGHVARGYTLRNTESLEKADITIFHLKDVDRHRSAALLRGIRNVRVLHLSIHDYDAQFFRWPLNSVHAFHNLLELEFKNHCDNCKLSPTWIVQFLHLVPNLKTLILDLTVADRVFESVPEEVPTCLLYHLKEISIFCFRGDTHTFEMECRSSIIEKLSSLPKISKKCELEIR
ncbi:hypothetical protein V6N13_038606 [Hibiscus sabdariffa]|uniref:F-box domain-containing protein n=2 Tax=Hibiscus sabdariffa TaxID=183260 RepID=A0ABR2B5H9_9ROSI